MITDLFSFTPKQNDNVKANDIQKSSGGSKLKNDNGIGDSSFREALDKASKADEKKLSRKENRDGKNDTGLREIKEKLEKLQKLADSEQNQKINAKQSQAVEHTEIQTNKLSAPELEKLNELIAKIKEILNSIEMPDIDFLKGAGMQEIPFDLDFQASDLLAAVYELLQNTEDLLNKPSGSILKEIENLIENLDDIKSDFASKINAITEIKAFIENAVAKNESPENKEIPVEKPHNYNDNKVKVIDNRGMTETKSESVKYIEGNPERSDLDLKADNNQKPDMGDIKFNFDIQKISQNETIIPTKYTSFTSAVTRSDLSALMHNIAGKAVITLENGKSEMRLKLFPPELGKLDMKFELERGALSARIVVSTPEAKMLFDQNLGALQRMMQESGVDVAFMDVSYGGEGNNENTGDFVSNGGFDGIASSIDDTTFDTHSAGFLVDSSVNFIA
jgi:flagellar hook-length control protein FliK